MPRTVEDEAYNAWRNQILDFATRLIYSKGHDGMTIRDILDGLQVSRGLFTTTSTPRRRYSRPWSTAWGVQRSRRFVPS